jgi:hypothetical protein
MIIGFDEPDRVAGDYLDAVAYSVLDEATRRIVKKRLAPSAKHSRRSPEEEKSEGLTEPDWIED